MQGGKEKFLPQRKDPHPLGMVEGPAHREGMARTLPVTNGGTDLPVWGRVVRLTQCGASQEVRVRAGAEEPNTCPESSAVDRAMGRWAVDGEKGGVGARMPDSLHPWVKTGLNTQHLERVTVG